MRLKKTWLIVGTIALSLSLFSSASANSEPQSDSSKVVQTNRGTVTLEESQKIKGREIYGLSTDPSIIESLRNKNSVSQRYGIYLSQEEEARLEERFSIQEKVIPQLKEDIKKTVGPDAFLGLYIDQANGGVINVGIREGASIEAAKNVIASKSVQELPIKIYQAKLSEEDFDKIANQISANEALRKQLGIESANVDFINQKLEVGISGNVASVAEVTKALSELTGQEEAIFEVKALDSTYKTSNEARYTTQSPILDGLVIDASPNTTGVCSVGFSAIDSSNTPYIVTAAHCWNSAGTGIYQGSNYIGYTSSKRHEGNNADALAIAVTSNSLLSNKLYGTSTLLSNVEVAGNDNLGDRVCKSGMHGDSCGVLLSKNKQGTWDGFYFDNLRVANYVSDGGDSGGTIHDSNTNKLKGIHKGVYTDNGTTYRVYSHVTHVASRLNITPVSWLNQ